MAENPFWADCLTLSNPLCGRSYEPISQLGTWRLRKMSKWFWLRRTEAAPPHCLLGEASP